MTSVTRVCVLINWNILVPTLRNVSVAGRKQTIIGILVCDFFKGVYKLFTVLLIQVVSPR